MLELETWSVSVPKTFASWHGLKIQFRRKFGNAPSFCYTVQARCDPSWEALFTTKGDQLPGILLSETWQT